MAVSNATPTSVYRYFDAHDVLVYVGVTSRGITRNREHNGSKVWWPFVARQDVVHFDTRAQALKSEADLINRYRPPFNTLRNPDAAQMRRAYLAFRSVSDVSTAPVSQDTKLLNARVHDAKRPLSLVVSTAEPEYPNWAVLRTHATDISTVQLLTPPTIGMFVPRIGSGGKVIHAERQGPCLALTIKCGWPPNITSAEARIRVVSNKPLTLGIKSLVIVATRRDDSC